MTRDEFDARHRERYRLVLFKHMTLAEALMENEADWRAMLAADEARGIEARAEEMAR